MSPGWKGKGVRNEAENYNIIVLESQETAQLLDVLNCLECNREMRTEIAATELP